MKKAVILHGTDGNHNSNWFPWLKAELQNLGYEVWVPDLPSSNKPNMTRYLDFLLNQDWNYQDNLLIGHSSGAVTILGLLQNIPKSVTINAAILVGAFSQVLANEPDWEQLRGLFDEPFDFIKIKNHANKFIFIHGSNDPWCPIEQAKNLSDQVGGELNIIENGQHFSISNDKKWTKFPQLIELLKQKNQL